MGYYLIIVTGPPFLKSSTCSMIEQVAISLASIDPSIVTTISLKSRSESLLECILMLAPPAFYEIYLIMHPPAPIILVTRLLGMRIAREFFLKLLLTVS